MKKQITYSVYWKRENDDEDADGFYVCHGLAPRVIVARIMGAIATNGPVKILSIVKDSAPATRIIE